MMMQVLSKVFNRIKYFIFLFVLPFFRFYCYLKFEFMRTGRVFYRTFKFFLHEARSQYQNSWLYQKFFILTFFEKYRVFELTQVTVSHLPGVGLIKREVQPEVTLGGYPIYDSDGGVQICSLGQVRLPEAYVVLFRRVAIFPGTAFVVKGSSLFYDYCKNIRELDALNKHEWFFKTVGSFKDASIYLNKRPIAEKTIPRGISLFEDFQYNYYHFLLEVLPKLSLLKGDARYLNYPLLIPKDLPSQFYEALSLVNTEKRAIIQLAREKYHRVNNLIYITSISYSNEVRHRVPVRGDYCINPNSIRFLRECCDTYVFKKAPTRLIYLDRPDHMRGLVNSRAVKALLVKLGFEIVDCGSLRFYEQVYLFSQAKVIVGPAGASFANLAFASAQAKVLTFFSGGFFDCYDIFLSIAQALGIEMLVLKGLPQDSFNVHSGYSIDISVLELLVKRIMQ